MLLLLRAALSVYALPYIALGAELTPDYRERAESIFATARRTYHPQTRSVIDKMLSR